MVDTNIDPVLIAERTHKRVSVISEHGSGSGLFYLLLKNEIVTARHKPETLIILSRGSILTSPGFRVHGSFFAHMDEFASKEDGLVLELGIRNQMTPFEIFAESYFPPYWGRWQLRAELDAKARYFPTRTFLGCDVECADQAMEKVFGSQNFDPDQLNDAINWTESYFYTEENLDFNHRIGTSFLPEIIRLCRENNIQLVLVQSKTLRFSREQPAPEAFLEYNLNLRAYAEANDVIFIDYSNDPRMTPELFFDVNHLTLVGRTIFSDMLSEELLNP
ncbi:MAG: hypothetical protein L0287_25600 [Anaerolineae bacterium]|nr:hypothetical protein [Anaerolineae bacterium]